MTVAPDLANAARKVRAMNDRLPDELQVDVAADWSALLNHIKGQTDWKARRIIEEWTEVMERRLCGTLLNAPLSPREDA
jgi:hypothetical protein